MLNGWYASMVEFEFEFYLHNKLDLTRETPNLHARFQTASELSNLEQGKFDCLRLEKLSNEQTAPCSKSAFRS